ncbi:MFS transporter [Jannaschia pohangensis]|uniref:Predicted arabinose efflux permease, MFS family n=1 Tax=Jannaschia pohangensis TaxID=390807 RepID=A0A1I3M7C0_9RHOB|nr:MFS transporter [Jannaschia pohangensis]SFI92891.1 Predicted arabinose efflux permease, MFS family [Jannaschia pohangensis]
MPRGLIWVFSGANFVIGMGAFLVIGALGPLARDLSLTPSQAGWVLTTYALAYAPLSPLLVSATGGIGRRRVMVFGMGLFALAALASALAPTPGWLFAARVLAAAGAGMTTPVIAAVAAGLAAPEQRGKVLSLVFLGLTIAQVLGVPAGSWIAYTYGWRAAFGLVAALAVAFTAVMWMRVPAGLTFQPVRLRDLSSVLVNGPLMLAITFTAVFLGAIYIPFTYLAPLLEGRMGLSRDGVTAALVVCGLGAVAGNLVGGWVADRLGPLRTILALACLQVAIMPILSLLPLPLGLAMGLFFVWNACGYGFTAGQQMRLVSLAGPQAPVALALNAACIYVGAAIGSVIGGLVVADPGLWALGLAGGACALVAVGWIIASGKVSPVDRPPART